MDFQSECGMSGQTTMTKLNLNAALSIEEWVFSLMTLLVTGIIAFSTIFILKKVYKRKNWPLLQELTPSISALIFLAGLNIFVDVAPLSVRTSLWAMNFIYVLQVLVFLRLILRGCLLAIAWSAMKNNTALPLEQGFIPLLRNMVTLFVFLTGGIMILKHFNYDVMSLMTALGVGSLAVGLAAKDTLSNMISGFILIIDRNLRPGDRINLGGSIGDVKEIGLRSTQIRTGDGNTLIVPNSELVNTKILNLSYPDREVSCSVSIRVPFSVPFPQVKQIALSILQQIDGVSKTKKPWVNLASISDGFQLIQIGYWVSDLNHSGGSVSELNERLLEEFKQKAIPFFHPVQVPPQY